MLTRCGIPHSPPTRAPTTSATKILASIKSSNNTAASLIAQKRIELYREFQQILSDEQPYTFLFVNKSVAAVQRRIRGVEVFPGGIRPIDWWVPAATQRYGQEPTLN